MKSRTIHCCSLVQGYQRRVLECINALGQQLQDHYPAIPSISATALDASPESIEKHLRANMPGVYTEPAEQDQTLIGKRILVLCSEQHPFVEIAREENPRAHWGIAVPMLFSVAWVENTYLWWHEALHLFNAKDCYNKFGINKCKDPHCVMQASPTHQSCGGRLHLCTKNQRRLSTDPI